jgi:glycogen debranching enzyme
MATTVERPDAGVSLAHDGWTVLSCALDGSIAGGAQGLYDDDARLLSMHRLAIEGLDLTPLGRPEEHGRHWAVTLVGMRGKGSPEGPRLPQDAWEIRLERVVGPAMAETIELRNHSMAPARARLRLELAADFADALVRGAAEDPRPTITTTRIDDGVEVRGRFEAGKRVDERGARFRVLAAGSPATLTPTEAGCRVAWDVELGPRGTWTTSIEIAVRSAAGWRGPASSESRDRIRGAWHARRTRLEGEPIVGRAFEQAAIDLASLRNWELEPSTSEAWVPNAGAPWFSGLFGRDVLTAGWQALMLGPEIARGALEITARSQGVRSDAWTEEQPGRIIHEQRRGPLSVLGLRPQAGYYGSQTATTFFPVALSEVWHWAGDDALLRRHRAAAARAIDWARRFGDLDGDGFLEYRCTSSEGLRNQGWKDSDEAIRHADGSIAEVPIATIEEQAFHYLALERMAEILVALDGPDDEVDRLLERAATLRERVDATFWSDALGFYAMGLDAGKRRIESIGSNPLHALAAGLLPEDRARIVADRLLDQDLCSGWGIRTLAASHPSYNPFAYHLGSVWPVENATALIGFRRYGLDDHLDRLLEGSLEAIAALAADRLPEALTGHQRRAGSPPLPYPEANPVQAWSASAVIQTVQAMLGLYPFAPAGVLALVRPRLPSWLPTVTVRRLRIGAATVSLRFERRDDGSASHEVTEQDGRLLVVTGPPPNAAEGKAPLEWLAEVGIRHTPGRLGRALRIALGFETRDRQRARSG